MKRSVGFLFASLFLMTGCGVYNPQAVDIPLIDHAGETRINASGGVTAFMAPTAAVTASHGFNDWMTGQAFVSYDFSRLYMQVSPGFYCALENRVRMECYLGLGGGYHHLGMTDDLMNNGSETDYAYTITGHYLLPFIQLNCGIRGLCDHKVDLAFGLKTGCYFPQFTYHFYGAGYVWSPEKDQYYDTRNLLVEPQVQVTLGDARYRFTGRLGLAILNDLLTIRNDDFMYDPLTFSMGVTFYL